MRSPVGSRWIAIGAIAALAIVVGVLALLAYGRANPDLPTQTPDPVPTFTLGAESPSPTPEPQPVALDTQRFLSLNEGQWWRATAGACNGTPPLIERSADGGQTWVDVTPRYRGVQQVQSLHAFLPNDAEIVAALGACETQALRTYTVGEFWEPYPDVLASSQYVSATDAGTVVLPEGPVLAPCATAWGLRADEGTLALLCDGRAWLRSADGQWLRLAPENAVAVAIDGGDVLVAHTAEDCEGIAVSRATGELATLVGCAEGTDATAPTAIALRGSDLYLWSGDAFTSLPGLAP